jgi:thiol-disulfide isomerase/thioredoxin
MTDKTSVVTTDRFQQGFTYADFIAQINVNQDRFAQNDVTAMEALTDDDGAFFKKAVENGCKVLVLGEDWCPDVYRGMPVIARIAKISGMEMRVFPRDLNLDIADEFLNNGEFRSIPTVVFFNADQKYLGHWVERPELAHKETAEITKELERDMPGQNEEAIRDARRERVNARYPAWQKDTVREIRELLGEKLGI